MEFFGVRILGLTSASLHKAVLTIGVIAVAVVLRAVLRTVSRLGHAAATRRSIWIRKNLRLLVGAVAALLVASVWFDEPHQLATFGGLLAGGAAFAMQNVLLSIAGYFVIVVGRVFDFGERIQLGGVRGDVLDIDLMKTTIMEMGVPESLFPDPHHWVGGRQYTGRVVTVVNAEIFKQPVFNYTRNFHFLWEEIRIPVRYGVDLAACEQILLDAAHEVSGGLVANAEAQIGRLRAMYVIDSGDLEPQVYVRLTDNWIELSLRFLVSIDEARPAKNRISREILEKFAAKGIQVASSTVELVRMPEVKVEAS